MKSFESSQGQPYWRTKPALQGVPPEVAAAHSAGSGSASPGDHERELLRQYRDKGDLRARDELVRRFLPLARQLARRYQRPNESLDDLVQVASLGLVKAIDRFEPNHGAAFTSFAVPTILGELKRYFRDSGWALHVPRGMQERVMQLNRAVASLSRELGRSPTAGELGDAMGLSREEVLETKEAAVAYDAASLDAPRAGEEDAQTYADSLGEEDERFELIEYGLAIAPTLKALPERDRVVLHLRFVEDLTQSEIAARIGVSQMHVSRLIRRALARLRAVADASP